MQRSRYFVFMSIVVQKANVFALVCPDIGQIHHADVKYSQEPPYNPGTVAKVKCDKGYKGHGNPKLLCLDDGSWSASPPFCSVRKCERDKNKLEKGRECQKKCKSDDDCKGQFKRCQCDDWCGKSCFNSYESCEKLPPPENGYINGSRVTYGYTVTYGCNEGFTLSGSSTRTCRSDKKWSGNEPKCLPLGSCGQSGVDDERLFSGNILGGANAKHGAWPWQVLLFFNANYHVGQFYDGREGFGGATIIDKKWILTAAHIFVEMLDFGKNMMWKEKFLLAAGMTTFPDPQDEIPEYIRIFEPNEVYRHNLYDVRTYDYDVALIRVGKRLKREGMRFVIDGDAPEGIIEFSWHIRPICLPCMKVDPYAATIDISKNFDNSKCESTPDFLKKNSKVVATGFGWARQEQEIDYYKPKTLQETVLKIASDSICVKTVQRRDEQARYTHRMFCAVSANESIVTDTRKGDSGGPVAKQVSRSGIKFWLQIGIVSWGFTVDDADPGYYTSVPSVMPWIQKIIKNNTEDTTCGKLQVGQHSRLLNPRKHWEVGDTAQIVCDDGFTVMTEKYQNYIDMKCLANGKWSQEPQNCIELTCRELQLKPYSKLLNYQTKWKIGDTATIVCEIGFKELNKERLTKIDCLETGEWSREPPICIELSCPILQINPHTKLVGYQPKWKFGDTVSIICEQGFKTTNGSLPKLIRCLSNGEWSSEPPKCTEITCREPHVQPHSILSNYKPKWKYGDTALIGCETGFGLQNEKRMFEIDCLANGEWNKEPPECVRKSSIGSNYTMQKNQFTKQFYVGSCFLQSRGGWDTVGHFFSSHSSRHGRRLKFTVNEAWLIAML